MAPGDSILLSRAEIELLAGKGFQSSAPPELAAELLTEGAQAVAAGGHRLSLVNIRESLAEALRTFASETGRDPADVKTANELAARVEQLAAI